MDNTDKLMDDALDALPLITPPPHLVQRVMLRVRQPQVVFRLDFLDVALPLFFALLSSLTLAVALSLALRWLNPVTVAEWKFAIQLAALRLSAAPFQGALVLALCLLGGLLAISLALLLGWGGLVRSHLRVRG